MVIEVPFGDATVEAVLPDDTFVAPHAGGRKLEPIAALDEAVNAALDAPLGMPRVEELAKAGSGVTIAFDDPTVPSFGPIRRVAIQRLLARLYGAGVREGDIRFICANALHRKFRAEELGVILGPDLVEEMGGRLSCHDAEDAENLVHFGQTPEGWDVELNRHAAESDLLIYVSSAAYRGFAGGWKSVCVGLSTFRSIRHHHTPDGMSMSVLNNPMHAMLNAMGRLLESKMPGAIFKVDAIEANPFQTARVFAGSAWAVREAALAVLSEAWPPRRELSGERFDVVLYGVPNWSPYAIFAGMNPILTLLSSGLGYLGGTIQALGKPGCTVIMATPCPCVWDDEHHPSYRDVWEKVLTETRDPYEIEARFTEHYAGHAAFIERYRFGHAFHPVHGLLGTHPLRRMKHCGRVIVAGIEDPATARHLGFEAAPSIEAALRMAESAHGKGMRVAYAQHPAAPTKVAM